METIRKCLAMILAGGCLFFFASGCTAVSSGLGHESKLKEEATFSEKEEARVEAFSKYAWGLALELESKASEETYEEYYLAALEALPESRPLFERVVRTWLKDEDYQQIVEVLTPLACENPEVVHLQILVSTALQVQEQYSKAVELLEHAYYETNPRSPELLREYVALLWLEGSYSEIGQLLRRAAKRPEFKAAFVLEYTLAVYYEGLSKKPQGTDYSERRLNRFRERSRKHARKAVRLLNQETYFQDFSRLFEILKDAEAWEQVDELFARGYELFPNREADLLFMQAQSLRLRGEPESALAKLSDLEDVLPKKFPYYARLGREFLELGALKKAHFYLNKAHQQSRNALHIRLLLAHTKIQIGRHQEAYQILDAVEEPIPYVTLLRSQALLGQGKPKKARDLAQKAWNQAETAEDESFFNTDVYLYLANIFEELGEQERTLELAELAYEADPESAQIQNFLGYLLADYGMELERAEKLISKAIDSEPESVAIRDSLAWVYFRQERYKEALLQINRTLNLAVKRGMKDDVIYSHAGDIYAANEYHRQAVYYWRQAILYDSDEAKKLNIKIHEALEKDGH